VCDLLSSAGFEVDHHVVADEADEIERLLRKLATESELVVTTGGTGFGPRDVTPEATRAVIEREAPGFAEAMRAAGRSSTPNADLSRAVAGICGSAVIVNLPGSPKGATESLQAILGILPHAIGHLRGRSEHR
jgi:molybdenum cofactor synthesis domain-containing protein